MLCHILSLIYIIVAGIVIIVVIPNINISFSYRVRYYRTFRENNSEGPEPSTTERAYTASALTRTEVVIGRGHESEGTATMNTIKEMNVLSDRDS